MHHQGTDDPDENPVAPVFGEEPAGDEPVPRGAAVTRARSAIESLFVRLIATAGIVGIGVAIAAIMASQHVQGWIIGLVVSLWSVVLAARLWSSRRR